jgi:hypothetical protein
MFGFVNVVSATLRETTRAAGNSAQPSAKTAKTVKPAR